jgi:hypothetical protein
MARSANTTMPTARALRGAGGLRGVHPRGANRGRGTRPSSGRGPSPRERWQRTGPVAPRAIDRSESLMVSGLTTRLPARLFAPASRTPLPIVVAWGAGGSTLRDLAADESWARELADLTGAIVVLCGYRRDEPASGSADAAASYADLSLRAPSLGGSGTFAVTGRGTGFRVAASLAAEAAAWPTLTTPRRCVAATPVSVAAAALREALALPASTPSQLRPGTEVRTRDGVLLGRVGEVRDGDFAVRRGLAADDLHIPMRAVERVQGAVTLKIQAAELPLRDWGRAAAQVAGQRDPSRN